MNSSEMKNYNSALKAAVLCGLMILSGCSETVSQSSSSGEMQDFSSLKSASKIQDLTSNDIIGDQIVFAGEELNVSIFDDPTIDTVVWNFGNNVVLSGLINIKHTYYKAGIYQISVLVTDKDGAQKKLQKTISVLDYMDNLHCAKDLKLNSPSELQTGTAASMTLTLPDCLTTEVSKVHWNFGDGVSSTAKGATSHTYFTEGNKELVVSIFARASSSQPIIVLNKNLNIVKAAEVEIKRLCPIENETRSISGQDMTRNESCGTSGQKEVKYKEVILQKCVVLNNTQDWVEYSRTTELISAGECLGQSCVLANEKTLKHLQVESDVVVGESKIAKQCQFNETGFFETYSKVADLKCENGKIIESNQKNKNLISSDSCPTYTWKATEEFTQCSADCGGTQSQIFQCLNNNNEVSDPSRCGGSAPVITRLCDKNPEAAKRSEIFETSEEANSSALCPKNEIGVILKNRKVTVTTNYACINHAVQKESVVTTPGEWQTTNYCRPFTAKRCSQDSVSNPAAHARLEWMEKCSATVPVIKEFLDKFEQVNSYKGINAFDSKRLLYPTFMQTVSGKEMPWKAPIKADAKCVIPETAFVAAVCISGCSTPDQQILVEAKDKLSQKYTPFLEALNKNIKFASVVASSSISETKTKSVAVDQWVSDMIDTEHDIIVIEFKSGRKLKVTPNHPVVMASGEIKEAITIKVNDEAAMLGGKKDQVKSLRSMKYFGKVYNLFLKSGKPEDNIVSTNGYLNGTALFQNEKADLLNSVVLRKSLTQGVFKDE